MQALSGNIPATARPTFAHEGNFNFTWGLHPDFDLTIVVSIATNQFETSTAKTVRDTGIGDAMAVIKYRFYRRDSPRGTKCSRLSIPVQLMMVEAKSSPPIHQRKEGSVRVAGFGIVAVRRLIKLTADRNWQFVFSNDLQRGAQQRCRILVQIDGRVRMRSQNGRGRQLVDLSFKARFHCVGFARIGHDRENFFHLEDLTYHMERVCFGTCSMSWNQASSTCCWRQASSRLTMM